MKKKLLRIVIGMFSALLIQSTCVTSCFAWCIHRETGALEVPPPGSDLWVEECCAGRPAHWPASAMPIPVYIYSGTPEELKSDIEDAVDAWNDVSPSYFEMQVAGSVGIKAHIPGAIVIGFDTTLCPDNGDPCLFGATSCKHNSVDSSWDGYEIESCTIFADAEPWREFPDRPIPLWVMMHELGHALGIMHPDVNPHGPGGQGCGREFLEATMECCDRQGRQGIPADVATLELDDIAAATALYPKWKYTLQVVDGVGNPVQGAAVWMEDTCFPHDGANREEGGLVLGDIPSCLVGDLAPSDTYVPDITYATGSDGKTGKFRVMHDEFCFTVVADGFDNLRACQTLPAPGNYIATVVLNRPPVCDADGPYTAICQGPATTLQLDGTGSNDPDGDPLSYSWTTSCPGGVFDDETDPTPLLSVTTDSGVFCNGLLTVGDGKGGSDTCSSTVTITDTTPPSITCPSDLTIECDQSLDPAVTGNPTVTDVCDLDPDISFSDSVTPGSCPAASTVVRTWTATDASGNTSSCAQTIEVVDTTPPEIYCSAPAYIQPPDAPISFTATATDNCTGNPFVEIESYDCFKSTKKGKTIDKTDSCEVELSGDTITILDSGGVGTTISWVVNAVDDCGNASTSTCSVPVVLPAGP